MSIFQGVNRLPEFEKDLKKLLKRFRTLEGDIEFFVQAQLNLYHKLNQDNGGIVRIPGVLHIEGIQIYKARKFACRALKGRGSQSGIRVVYAYQHKHDIIEFIEIYFKGDKENEDKGRIHSFLQSKRK